mmetsp:Transcript_81407/g.226746  ORF Transcript_81407/g.226746 Transcript_81407/m.226746 type:complete len:480 (-) Transcript_81407:11-1450(-)
MEAVPQLGTELLDENEEAPWHFWTEARMIVGLAMPVALSNWFEYLPVTFLVAAVGHAARSREALAATALGRNYFNACWSIAWGFTSALHTLAPQAEGGGRRDLHALHFQRAVLIVSVLCVPLALLQVVSGSVLDCLGQDAALSAAAQPFAMRLIPRLFAESYFTIMQRIGQAMGHATAVAAITSAGCACSIIFLWLFVDVFHLGFLGAAWACSSWNLCNMCLLAAFLFMQRGRGRGRSLFVPYKPCKQVFSWSGLREYLSLAVPSTLQACLEWWAIDLGVMLAAGTLPDPDLNLGANVVVASVADLCYMLWLGVQGATSIAVGKRVGAGQAVAAKRTIYAAVLFGLICAAFVSFVLLVTRHAIASVLTTSAALQAKSASTMVVLAAHVFADSTNCVLGGALRGMGRQARGAQFQFAGFYLVGFPMGAVLLLLFRNTPFGLECLWVAVMGSAVTSAVFAGTYIARADWAAILQEARTRNN